MTTLTKNTAVGYGYAVANGYDWVTPAKALARTARNVTLFFAAPFIGLAYMVAFPFVGLALIAWIAAKALAKNRTARRVGTLIAAPFIALGFVTLGPVLGLGALVWIGGRACVKR